MKEYLDLTLHEEAHGILMEQANDTKFPRQESKPFQNNLITSRCLNCYNRHTPLLHIQCVLP